MNFGWSSPALPPQLQSPTSPLMSPPHALPPTSTLQCKPSKFLSNVTPPQCHPSNVIPNVPPNVTIAGYPQRITLQSHPQTSPLPRHLNVLPPMSPSHLIPNVPPQRASLRHLQQSQKSPAIGGYLLLHSGRVMAGRCGHFDRTCHKRMPLSNV